MEAASALTALGDEDDSRASSSNSNNKYGEQHTAGEDPSSAKTDDASTNKKKKQKRYLPNHKKPDAALTFPEKVSQLIDMFVVVILQHRPPLDGDSFVFVGNVLILFHRRKSWENRGGQVVRICPICVDFVPSSTSSGFDTLFRHQKISFPARIPKFKLILTSPAFERRREQQQQRNLSSSSSHHVDL
jgi:hypothetical protein